MKRIISLMFALSVAVISFDGSALAQGTRSYVNKGVKLYKDGKYVDSEVEFKKGLGKSPNNFQAHFNLGDSYYKQDNYQDAMKSFQSSLSKTKSPLLRSKVYYNIGNSLLKDKKLKESVAAYTEALKLDPGDMSTKYNLSYALDMLKHQKNQNKNNKNKNNQNKKNQNKQNQNKQNNNQNNNNKNKQNNQQQNRQQNQQEQLSKEQAKAIFAALNHEEQKLQKKLRKFVGKPMKVTKDW